jgi:cell division protein FtsL
MRGAQMTTEKVFGLAPAQWVSWITATVVAAITMTFTTLTLFSTKGETKEIEARLEKRVDKLEDSFLYRLDKIDSKLDKIQDDLKK